MDIERLKIAVGKKIREAREIRKLSQEDVAKQLNVTTGAYGALERGKNLIGLQYLLQLPLILNKPITFFLPGYVADDTERDSPRMDPRFQYIESMWPLLPEYAKDIFHRQLKLMETFNPDLRRAMRVRGMEVPELPDETTPEQRKLLEDT